MLWKILLCIRRFLRILEKIVVFPNRLLCAGKHCCVLQIVVFSERLCSPKGCRVPEDKLSCVLPLWATAEYSAQGVK